MQATDTTAKGKVDDYKIFRKKYSSLEERIAFRKEQIADKKDYCLIVAEPYQKFWHRGNDLSYIRPFIFKLDLSVVQLRTQLRAQLRIKSVDTLYIIADMKLID